MTDKIYHVTAAANHGSIVKAGIDPLFSRGKRQTSWWCSYAKIPYVLAKVSYRHKIPVSDLEIWILPAANVKRMEKTNWTGIFQTPCNHRVSNVVTSGRALDMWQRGEEF